MFPFDEVIMGGGGELNKWDLTCTYYVPFELEYLKKDYSWERAVEDIWINSKAIRRVEPHISGGAQIANHIF